MRYYRKLNTLADKLVLNYLDCSLDFHTGQEGLSKIISKRSLYRKRDNIEVIYSDGHCPEDYEEITQNNGKLNRPIYIKPHGTISHLSTLRFTREDFL